MMLWGSVFGLHEHTPLNLTVQTKETSSLKSFSPLSSAVKDDDWTRHPATSSNLTRNIVVSMEFAAIKLLSHPATTSPTPSPTNDALATYGVLHTPISPHHPATPTGTCLRCTCTASPSLPLPHPTRSGRSDLQHDQGRNCPLITDFPRFDNPPTQSSSVIPPSPATTAFFPEPPPRKHKKTLTEACIRKRGQDLTGVCQRGLKSEWILRCYIPR